MRNFTRRLEFGGKKGEEKIRQNFTIKNTISETKNSVGGFNRLSEGERSER